MFQMLQNELNSLSSTEQLLFRDQTKDHELVHSPITAWAATSSQLTRKMIQRTKGKDTDMMHGKQLYMTRVTSPFTSEDLNPQCLHITNEHEETPLDHTFPYFISNLEPMS